MSKKEYWQQHIKAWQDSGLSQVAYSTSQDLKVHNLTYWRKRLNVPSPSKLIPVRIPASTTVRLILGSKVVIELPTNHVADVLVSLRDRGLLHAAS
ncbi:MAG: hypothetical protein ACJAYF_000277 [Arenicella sp.]|jgi:hypothetical protein